ncbi:hypothetical protein JNW90_13740 [Micromonospora sp. STR1s_5]|nr:hypothetical protein [Micromonospora sp. STR1s_5]
MNIDAAIHMVDDLHTIVNEYGYQRNLLVEICQKLGAIEVRDGQEVAKPNDILKRIESLQFRAGFMNK